MPDRAEKYRSFFVPSKEVQPKMPVPHLEIRIVQRSKGSSAVAGAAYQAGEKLFSEYDQKMKNYKDCFNAFSKSIVKTSSYSAYTCKKVY